MSTAVSQLLYLKCSWTGLTVHQDHEVCCFPLVVAEAFIDRPCSRSVTRTRDAMGAGTICLCHPDGLGLIMASLDDQIT